MCLGREQSRVKLTKKKKFRRFFKKNFEMLHLKQGLDEAEYGNDESMHEKIGIE